MKLFFTLLALLCAGTLWATPVSKVLFEYSGSTLGEEQLLSQIRQKSGEEFDQTMLDEDVKRLYQTGWFQDVAVATRTATDGSMELIFQLKLKPRISSIVISGNQKFENKELLKELDMVPGVMLNDAKLSEGIQKLRELYRKRGYNSATVNAEVVNATDRPEEVELNILIDEKLRLRVNNVKFENSTLYSNFKLKWAINNRYMPFSSLLEIGLFHPDALDADKALLRNLYWEKGFLDFEVKDIQLIINPEDPEMVDLTFVLFEGAPYEVSSVKISGTTVLPEADLLRAVSLVVGQAFAYDSEQASLNAIAGAYEHMGHADVNVRSIRNADFANHTVDVEFIVEEGPKYTVRDVVISGNQITKDKVMRRELAVQPDDPADRKRVDVSRSRLMGMGYFSEVKATLRNADQLDEKDVNIEVVEKDMYNIRAGIGWSDVNSAMGMLELSNNNFDLFAPGKFFSGGGQRFRAMGVLGVDRSGFNVDFTEPWLFDLPLRYELSGYMNQSDYDFWSERRTGVRTALSRKFFDDFTLFSLGYKFERVDVKDMDQYAGPELHASVGHEYVGQFSVMLDRDTRNSLFNPTSGYQVALNGAIAPKALGSSNNFYRLEARASGYYSLFDDAIVFMGGAKAGVVDGFSRSDDVPLYERYFLGGGDSIRGFTYRSVSPLDSKGYPMGGNTMLLLTGEVSHPIFQMIRGAVFADIGNVWDDSYKFGALNVGAGYGLRVMVPYLNAPIKIDLAYPVVSKQENEKRKLHVHFNVGFTF